MSATRKGSVLMWRVVRQRCFDPDDQFCRNLRHDRKAWESHASAQFPGRWNRQDHPVTYAAQSRSLAAWEVYVHLLDGKAFSPNTHYIACAEVDEELIVKPEDDEFPPDSKLAVLDSGKQKAVRDFGHRRLIEANALVLQVPSAVVAGEFNYVINVAHPNIHLVRSSEPEPFRFDDRLFRKAVGP